MTTRFGWIDRWLGRIFVAALLVVVACLAVLAWPLVEARSRRQDRALAEEGARALAVWKGIGKAAIRCGERDDRGVFTCSLTPHGASPVWVECRAAGPPDLRCVTKER